MFVFPHLPTFQRIVSCVLSALRITNIRLLVYYSKLFIEFNIPLFPTLPHRCLLNIDLINGDMSWFSDTDGEYWNIQSSCDYKKRQQTTAIHPTLSGLFSLNFVNPERVLTLNWMWKNGKDVGISVDVTSVIHLTHWALYWTVCLSWCGCEQKILFLTMCKIKNKSFSQVHKCTWKNIKMFQLRLLSVFALIYV